MSSWGRSRSYDRGLGGGGYSSGGGGGSYSGGSGGGGSGSYSGGSGSGRPSSGSYGGGSDYSSFGALLTTSATGYSSSGAPSYGGSVPTSRLTPSGGSGGGGSSGSPQNLDVSRCQSAMVANIIQGSYVMQGSNHGKPFYKKEGPQGSVSVLIYFWDDRDGASFSGWWFGPKVGGDQVWAYNGSKSSAMPPLSGWKVPWDGPEDQSLRITPSGGGSGSRSGVHSSRESRHDSGAIRSGSRESLDMIVGARQQAEDRRRRDHDERQRKVMQQQQRRRQDEERRCEEERRRRAAEEARRQKQQEEEEEARRRAELKRKQREEEELRKREQAAAMVVRKIIQKVRIANPENYDHLRAELEEAQAAQLEHMGSQADRVSQEAEKALQQAQQRIDDINQKREADEKRRQEEEQRRKQEEELCDRLLKEATEEVNGIEDKVLEASEAAKAAIEDKEATPEQIVDSAAAAEEKIAAVLQALEGITKSVDDKFRETGYTDAARRVRDDMHELTNKLSSHRRGLDRDQSDMKRMRDKAARKAAALKKLAEKKARFSKHDSDSDGKLNREEVKSFSLTTYQFEVPEEVLAKVMKTLEPIVFEKFDRVRAMIAIAKSEIEARKKRAEAEEKRKAVDEAKAEMQKVIDEAAKLLAKAEEGAGKAENMARPLHRNDNMSADKIKEEASATLASTKEAEDTLQEALTKLIKVEKDCAASDDLNGYDRREVPRLQQRHGRIASRLEKVTAAVKAANEKAMRKAYTEIAQKRTEAVTAMRGFMTTEGKTSEQLFEHIGSGSDITSEKFAEFLKGLSGFTLEKDQDERLFQHIVEEAESIPKEMFLDLIRLYYKCVKATVLTEHIMIKSKTIRRLEMSEVLEVIEGPTKEEGVNVQRVKVQAVNDAAMGWATIAGNQGTPFLEPGGNLFTCVKETHITDTESITDSKTIRKLSKGEIIEVMEFAKKVDQGIKRVKGKAKEDGASGWITVCGNQGTTFLEPC